MSRAGNPKSEIPKSEIRNKSKSVRISKWGETGIENFAGLLHVLRFTPHASRLINQINPLLVTPAFKSEQEEADWWFANREIVEDRVIKYGRKALIETQSVTIRLPKDDLERAREIAAREGITVIKRALRQALRAS